ncbi:MAG: hypothetical protein ACE5FT_01025 [Candidatus Nanoarchaeia archaeon]
MPSPNPYNVSLEEAGKICQKHGLEAPDAMELFQVGTVNDVYGLDDSLVLKVINPRVRNNDRARREAEICMICIVGDVLFQKFMVMMIVVI